MEIEVKGNSGCNIEVVRESNKLLIYKSTQDASYVNRLLKQAHKQQEAAQTEYQHIRVPQIYEILHDDCSAVIKMQYVYSKNFVEYFEHSGFEQIDYLIGAIEYFIEKELAQSPLQTVSQQVFVDKVKDVQVKTLAKLGNQDTEINRILAQSIDIISTLGDWELPIGRCHGDLTFSNILFNGNNYYLIDFLDSYVETPLQDIVKVRQDTAYRWSQLMYTQPYDSVRLRIIFDKIDREIDSYFSEKYNWYRAYYKPMQLINMLRILPYSNESRVTEFLKTNITQLLNEIQSNNTCCRR